MPAPSASVAFAETASISLWRSKARGESAPVVQPWVGGSSRSSWISDNRHPRPRNAQRDRQARLFVFLAKRLDTCQAQGTRRPRSLRQHNSHAVGFKWSLSRSLSSTAVRLEPKMPPRPTIKLELHLLPPISSLAMIKPWRYKATTACCSSVSSSA